MYAMALLQVRFARIASFVYRYNNLKKKDFFSVLVAQVQLF